MPAAAVIPAPIAYIKVVAVKTLVVGRLRFAIWFAGGREACGAEGNLGPLVTVKKLECLKRAFA